MKTLLLFASWVFFPSPTVLCFIICQSFALGGKLNTWEQAKTIKVFFIVAGFNFKRGVSVTYSIMLHLISGISGRLIACCSMSRVKSVMRYVTLDAIGTRYKLQLAKVSCLSLPCILIHTFGKF